jgi:hypothetical protein
MSCAQVRARLSAYLDAELTGAESRLVPGHLASCVACARHLRSLRGSLELLAELPPLAPRDSIAAQVLDRLEVECRGPGLAMLFRPVGGARPLMGLSLLPACFVFAAAIAFCLIFHRAPVSDAADAKTVGVPRLTSAALANDPGPEGEEGSLFFETIVGRDGSVARVKLLEGNALDAASWTDALRRERFAPPRFRGQSVAVSVYRLISRMEVVAPRT